MEVVYGFKEFDFATVATIGNFDGVHRGHQAVIKTLLQASTEFDLPATVITFEPLAKEFFTPQQALRIHPISQRINMLQSLGVDRVLVIPFDHQFAATTANQFIDRCLSQQLKVHHLTVGDDFCFGRDRSGDFNLLQARGDFQVVSHGTFLLDDKRVSSGRVRDALKSNDFNTAKRLLGRDYSLQGMVVHGQAKGRTIGFPTANLNLGTIHYAVQGVYAVQVQFADAKYEQHFGVANIGFRPTVDGADNRLEVHIFDFDEDIYGEEITVLFKYKIRNEQKFDSFASLTVQIRQDAEQARHFFASKLAN